MTKRKKDHGPTTPPRIVAMARVVGVRIEEAYPLLAETDPWWAVRAGGRWYRLDARTGLQCRTVPWMGREELPPVEGWPTEEGHECKMPPTSSPSTSHSSPLTLQSGDGKLH